MGWKEFTDHQVMNRCSAIYTAPFCFGGLSTFFWKQVSQAKYIWTDRRNIPFHSIDEVHKTYQIQFLCHMMSRTPWYLSSLSTQPQGTQSHNCHSLPCYPHLRPPPLPVRHCISSSDAQLTPAVHQHSAHWWCSDPDMDISFYGVM